MFITNLIISNTIIKQLTYNASSIIEWLKIFTPIFSTLAVIISVYIAWRVHYYTKTLNKNIHSPALFVDLPKNLKMSIDNQSNLSSNKGILKICKDAREREANKNEKYLIMKNMKDSPVIDFSWKMYWYHCPEGKKDLIEDLKEIKIPGYYNDNHILLNVDPFSIGMKNLLNTDIIKKSNNGIYMLVIILLCNDANGEKIKIGNSPFIYFFKTEVENNKFTFYKEHKSQEYVNKLREALKKNLWNY